MIVNSYKVIDGMYNSAVIVDNGELVVNGIVGGQISLKNSRLKCNGIHNGNLLISYDSIAELRGISKCRKVTGEGQLLVIGSLDYEVMEMTPERVTYFPGSKINGVVQE